MCFDWDAIMALDGVLLDLQKQGVRYHYALGAYNQILHRPLNYALVCQIGSSKKLKRQIQIFRQ